MKALKNKPSFKFAVYLWKNYRSMAVLGILTLTIGALIDASSAILIAPIFDLILQEHGQAQGYTKITETVLTVFENIGIPQSTSAALIIFLLIYTLRGILAVIAGWIEAKIRSALCMLMTVNLFKSVINANWNFFLNKNQGEFINSVTRETQYVGFAYQAFNNCVVAFFQIATFATIALLISWQLTLICIGMAVIFALPLFFLSNLNYKWGQKSVKAASQSNSITQESFSLSKVIQAFGCYKFSVENLREQQEIQKDLNVRFYTLTKLMHEFYYPLGLVSVIAGFYFSKHFSIPFTELTVILYCLWKCVPFMASLMRSRGQFAQYLPSFENIRALEDEALSKQLPQGGAEFAGLKHQISLKNIKFSYDISSSAALDRINFSLQKGKMTALVGHSGSGKSTLADIIMGFHEIQEGEFLIDDKAFTDINLESYRQSIGYVPQQSVLFNASIRQNLLWAKEDATDEELEEACKLSNCFEFIEKMPHKMDSVVGDRGLQLSGGQVQRVALARALLRKPEILILDEATSSLDSESEALIQQSINEIAGSTTLLIIAHRLSTVQKADTIYVLNEGRIIESGSFRELKADSSGFFNNMLMQQETFSKIL